MSLYKYYNSNKEQGNVNMCCGDIWIKIRGKLFINLGVCDINRLVEQLQ